MNKVRTKSQPWKEVEVSDAGLLDLQRRDSLAEDKPAGASPASKKAGQPADDKKEG